MVFLLRSCYSTDIDRLYKGISSGFHHGKPYFVKIIRVVAGTILYASFLFLSLFNTVSIAIGLLFYCSSIAILRSKTKDERRNTIEKQ
jgi:uncharacterized membrane protein